MEPGRYWHVIEAAWDRVDRGRLCAALLAQPPAATEILDKFARFLAELGRELDRMPLTVARVWLGVHHAHGIAMDRDDVRTAVDQWGGDWDGSYEFESVIALFGSRFFDAVSADASAASPLAESLRSGRRRRADDVGMRGWSPLVASVKLRWRGELVREVTDAFAEVADPGDDDVTSADWATTEECRHFRGKHWRTLSPQDFYRRSADLFFFTPRGFQFLLPGFLLASLSHPEGWAHAEKLLFLFGGDADADFVHKRLALLTAGQRAVLGSALAYHYEWCDDGKAYRMEHILPRLQRVLAVMATR